MKSSGPTSKSSCIQKNVMPWASQRLCCDTFAIPSWLEVVSCMRDIHAINGTFYRFTEATSTLVLHKPAKANESAEPRMQEIGWLGGTISILPLVQSPYSVIFTARIKTYICPIYHLPTKCAYVVSVLAILCPRHDRHCMRVPFSLSHSRGSGKALPFMIFAIFSRADVPLL